MFYATPSIVKFYEKLSKLFRSLFWSFVLFPFIHFQLFILRTHSKHLQTEVKIQMENLINHQVNYYMEYECTSIDWRVCVKFEWKTQNLTTFRYIQLKVHFIRSVSLSFPLSRSPFFFLYLAMYVTANQLLARHFYLMFENVIQ